jgi:restriction system protein
MPIPQNFQTIMLPFLEAVSDGESHNMNEILDALADYFKLTEEEKTRKYPTGSAYIFNNKARFARLYLLKAGLLESTQKSFIKISDDGAGVLAKKPKQVNLKLLETYPKYIEFKQSLKERNRERKETIVENTEMESQTPHELIEYGYQKIKKELSQEILIQTKQSSPQFFEKLVVELLLKMGYGGSLKDAGKAIGQSGDGGIDGIIKEDKLGLDIIYIQAKR